MSDHNSAGISLARILFKKQCTYTKTVKLKQLLKYGTRSLKSKNITKQQGSQQSPTKN